MKQEILAHLSPEYPWAQELQYFETIDSTNTRLKQLAAAGAPNGTVLIADQQTGGRGRLGRSFLSPPGLGVYLSMLLRVDCDPTELMHLTCASACAVCDAIENACGVRPGIKWTNDLVYEQKKLTGILTELGLDTQGRAQYAIIGVGVNCCHTRDDFPPELQTMAASLAMICGKPIDRSRVAAAIMEALWGMCTTLLSSPTAWREPYRKDCITIGKDICVVRGDSVRRGTALDVDERGALVVRYEDGQLEAVNSGEVSVRGMYGYL